MFKAVIIMTGVTLSSYAIQDISCVDFVSMNNSTAKSVIESFRKSLKIDHFNTNPNQADRAYIYGTASDAKNKLKRCIALRKISRYTPNSTKRYLGFEELNEMVLENQSEKNIYYHRLKESKNFFKKYSSASIVGNLCSNPLVYLTIQPTSRGTQMVNEARVENNQVILRQKEISVDGFVKFKCGTNAIKNQYISYLNSKQKRVALSYKRKVIPEKEIVVQDSIDNNTYITTSLLTATDNLDISKKISISKDKKLTNVQHRNGVTKKGVTWNDVVFNYEGRNYCISLKHWEQGTRLGGEQ